MGGSQSYSFANVTPFDIKIVLFNKKNKTPKAVETNLAVGARGGEGSPSSDKAKLAQILIDNQTEQDRSVAQAQHIDLNTTIFPEELIKFISIEKLIKLEQNIFSQYPAIQIYRKEILSRIHENGNPYQGVYNTSGPKMCDFLRDILNNSHLEPMISHAGIELEGNNLESSVEKAYEEDGVMTETILPPGQCVSFITNGLESIYIQKLSPEKKESEKIRIPRKTVCRVISEANMHVKNSQSFECALNGIPESLSQPLSMANAKKMKKSAAELIVDHLFDNYKAVLFEWKCIRRAIDLKIE